MRFESSGADFDGDVPHLIPHPFKDAAELVNVGVFGTGQAVCHRLECSSSDVAFSDHLRVPVCDVVPGLESGRRKCDAGQELRVGWHAELAAEGGQVAGFPHVS